MKLLYFLQNKKTTLGVATDKGVLQLGGFSDRNLTNEDLVEIEKAVKNFSGTYLKESDLQILSCNPRPSKIICIGLNYRKHAVESGMAIPTVPVVFTKYANTLIDFGQDVILGSVGSQFDYEVELAFIFGKKAKNIKKENALDYVLGYTVSNDMSCRDLQFRTSQWLMGKSLDTYLPLGKYLTTADEVSDPQNLQLTCSLNGEERQNSNTSDMIFSIAEIIEDLTHHMTMEPGDIVLTGTPAGVIFGLPVKNWLKPGDVVKVEIEKLGYTINKMI